MTSPTVPLIDRLIARTDYGDGTGCWLWTGGVAPKGDGYGHLGYQGKDLGAHRLAWEIANERSVPTGMLVCHTCDVRRCVRPSHLFIGTMVDNIRDASRKGRMHPGEADGQAKLTADVIPLIRARRRNGEGWTQLARAFGVTDGAIRQACTGLTWRHVA